ncbi:unnamed protein product [Phytophthora fragariaefolia]|uniref:Unnamed protein product n=1 Tax=Phytophthora fragariaefolia TaxID=1490495 RepID=A0A9W7CW26_9STRA|nr:unnamed protein product [Phytophthora fragariaefolia]
MEGMKDDYEYDTEGDVKMSMPQPIFEVTRAPSLKVWSQASITTFLRERRQYEVTGEVQAAVTRSIRTTIEPRVLEHVAHYILEKDAASVTDDMLVAEMKRKVGAMMNDRVPDVTQLFSRELKMDLAEVDVEARIASYFMTFDRLVEDNGLSAMLGRGPAVGEEGRRRVKVRCKLLLANVTPEILKVDLRRLVELTHREAKVNDLDLHDLMIERTTRQQQYHLMQAEIKQSAAPRIKAAAAPATKATQRPGKPRLQHPGAPGGVRSTEEQRLPPRDGCFICKGAHWASDCPTATAEQKAEVAKTLREKRDRQPERVKRITTDGEPTFRSAVINGVLDVPFCPDTGSDANIIGRPVFDELRNLVPSLRIERVKPPARVIAAGGNTMLCREKVHIDLQIVTAAGPLALLDIERLVLDAPEEELL